jgi:hypothetical protein
MTVDRELFRSLREGDIVRFRKKDWGRRSFAEGPIHKWYCCGSYLGFDQLDFLRIIERAPKPFYKNADHAEPLPGDVATDSAPSKPMFFIATGRWITVWGDSITMPPGELTLLYRQS